MRKIKINILICLIILTGFSSVGAISYITYSKIIKDDIKNISKLTATNIYSDINSQLTKPIFVALTMANDSFVDNWLKEEKNNVSSLEYQKKMTDYLNGIRMKYKYNSVFLVSDYSNIYYHFEGINKVINQNNQHDQWYYDYVNSNLTYDLDVDTDEVNQNTLSVFVNCRIEDDEDKLLGVTGVGLELNQVQNLLKTYKEDFQLEAMLFDKNGVVQIHSDSNLIEKINVFNYKSLEQNKSNILGNKDSIAVYNYKDGKSEGYMITKYIEDLDWYLLVKKDTSVLANSFQTSLIKDILVFFAVLFFIMFIIDKLIKSNDNSLLHMAKTDTLTGLTNRRGFDEAMEKIIHNSEGKENCYIFVFDIDNFKNINDIYGHLTGDDVIRHIGNIVSDFLKERGKVFRWGGDEFAGFIFCDNGELEEIINNIYDFIRNNAEEIKCNATISMGISLLQETDTVDTFLKRADKALYLAKESGKNKYIII